MGSYLRFHIFPLHSVRNLISMDSVFSWSTISKSLWQISKHNYSHLTDKRGKTAIEWHGKFSHIFYHMTRHSWAYKFFGHSAYLLRVTSCFSWLRVSTSCGTWHWNIIILKQPDRKCLLSRLPDEADPFMVPKVEANWIYFLTRTNQVLSAPLILTNPLICPLEPQYQPLNPKFLISQAKRLLLFKHNSLS